jgi:hypothetical protein
MVTRRTQLVIVVAVTSLVTAVAGAQRSGAAAMSCAAGPASNSTPFDTITKVAMLVGSFDVVMFDTTSLSGGTRQHSGKLSLWLQDSVPKKRATMARKVGQQFLVGMFEVAAPDSGEPWSDMTSRDPQEPGAFWTDGFLRLGNFGPKNGVSLYFRSITAEEIRGMWTSHAGTAIIVDFTGDREPDESGYFCARRVR